MADKEGTRKHGDYHVVSQPVPDVCQMPCDTSMVPVAY